MSTTVTAPGGPASQDGLAQAIADVIVPSAVQVDREGTFPTQNIQALSAAGVLGLLSAPDVGGGRPRLARGG